MSWVLHKTLGVCPCFGVFLRETQLNLDKNYLKALENKSTWSGKTKLTMLILSLFLKQGGLKFNLSV